jgi:RimJ/RimL family protein N-acetyltransferase
VVGRIRFHSKRNSFTITIRENVFLDAGDVALRPYEDRDRTSLVAILGRTDLMNLVLEERPFGVNEAETFILNNFHVSERLHYGTVTLKSTGEAIGFSGFRACAYLNEDDTEFGWVLAKEHHGRGFATALGVRLIIHALESWRLPRVLAACNPLNAASEHILRDKLHMRFERSVEPRKGFRRNVYSAAPGWCR